MSTNPQPRHGMARAAAPCLAVLLTSCASAAPGPGHGFAEVRLARPSPPPAPAYLQPRPPQEAPPAPGHAPPDLRLATARVLALLTDDGFTVELRREGAVEIVSATRMGAPAALSHEATCPLKAMRRPDFSASELTVRLTSSPGGVAAAALGRFVLVDINLISGDLSRQTCRSNGVLETALDRVVSG